MNIEEKKQKIREKNKKIEEKEKRKVSKENTNLPIENTKGLKKWLKKIGMKLGIGVSLLASVGSVSKVIEETSQNDINNNEKTESDNERNNKLENEKLNELALKIGIDMAKLGVIEKPEIIVEEETIEPETTIATELQQQTLSPEEMAYKKKPQNIQIVDENVNKDTIAPESLETTAYNEGITHDLPEKIVEETTTNIIEHETSKEVETMVFNDEKETNSSNSQEEQDTKTVVVIKDENSNANISSGKVYDEEISGEQNGGNIVENKKDIVDTNVTLAEGNGTNEKGEAKPAPDDVDKIINNGKDGEEETLEENYNEFIEPEDPFER